MVKVILIKEVLIVIIFLVFFNFRVSLAQTIAFERNGGIWVADANGDNQEKICKGYDPDISPDGTLIAFTAYQNDSRYIAIVEIKSKKNKNIKINTWK